MATKGNLKSVRLSDDLIELIEQQAGPTFTAKLENLVTRCVWELPEQERRLEKVRKQIQNEQERLTNLQSLYRKLHNIYADLDRKTTIILRSVNQAIQEIDSDL